jgi:tetratricopeptide (TPR) repeat protein
MGERGALAGVALAAWLITVGAFFPGVMSPDSLDQLRQADAWSYSTTQPPIMTLLWSMLNLVIAGPALMLFLQAAMWWGGWVLVIGRLVPARRRWVQPLVLLVLGFWPPLFAMTGTIWRDVHMTLALLVAIGLLLQDPALGRERRRLVVAGLLIAYASAVRINAVFSVLPLAGWVVLRAGRAWALQLPRRAALPLGAALVLVLVLAGRVINPALASKLWYPVQNLRVFDLVGISTRTGENLVPPSLRNGIDAPASIAGFYSAFSCFHAYYGASPSDGRTIAETHLATTEDDAVLAELASVWWHAVREHPRAYLAHRVAVFAANMGWSDRPLHYAYERGVPPNSLDVRWHPSWVSQRAYAAFDATLEHASWSWRPWLYVWISLLTLVGAAVAWRRGTRVPAVFLVISSGILYTLPYLFAAPAADLRYHHWPIASAFLGCLLLFERVRLPDARRLALGALAVLTMTLALAWAAWSSRIDFGPLAPISARAQMAVQEGNAALGRADWAAAQASFERAAERDPYWWVPETNLGIAAQQLGDVPAALAHHERAVQLDRRQEGARARRAAMLESLGRHAEALADHELLGGPAARDYATNKSAATAAAARSDGAGAARHSIRCLQLDAERFARDVIEVAGAFFKDEATAREGVHYFQRLAQVAPKAWWVHANLGLLAARIGDTELAQKEAELGEALKPR